MPLDRLAHLVVMAFDGFIIFRHVDPARPCDDETIELVCTLLLGRESAPAAQRRALRSAPPKSARHPPKGRSVPVPGGIR
jgi:hypothetical protein